MKRFGPLHLGLLALALVNMVPVVEVESSWGLLSIALASALLSCVYHQRAGGRRLPRWAMLLSVLGACGFLVYEMFFPHEEATVHIIDLAHFLLLLCCLKFFELHTHRDAGLIAFISFLLLVISAFVSASLLFGLAAAIDVTFGLAWLTAFHTQREQVRVHQRQRAAPAGGPGLAIDGGGAARPVTRRRTILTTAGCSSVLLVTATVVFVSMPRNLEGSLFGRIRGFIPGSVTGFSDVVQLSDTQIFEDDSTVLRARFTRNGELLTDATFQPYLRGYTFDRYFEGRWRRTPRALGNIESGEIGAPRPLFDDVVQLPPDRVIRQEIWLEPIGTSALFSVYPPLTFGSSEIKEVTLDRKDLVLQTPRKRGRKSHYVVDTSPDRTTILANRMRRRPRVPRDGWSGIPSRVERFAQDFFAAAGDPTDPLQHEYLAGRIRDYLSAGEFEYTFDRGPSAPNLDWVEDFLFENRRGHCEYFASAMAVLCQAVGIRARLISGYHGGEFNQVGGFYQIRQRDAHTWVEAYLTDRGWTVFDPSPPSAIEQEDRGSSLLANSMHWIDFLRFKWSTLVITFDDDTRAGLVNGLQQWIGLLTQIDHRPKPFMDRVTALLWGPELPAFWMRLLYWLILVLCITWLILGFRVLWIIYLRFRESLSARDKRLVHMPRRPDARFYDRLLLLLAHKGHVKPVESTPREFARRLARSHADLTELPELTEWFYRAQYGRRPLATEQQERVQAFLRRLREGPPFGVR